MIQGIGDAGTADGRGSSMTDGHSLYLVPDRDLDYRNAREATDADLAELGYVKAEVITGEEMEGGPQKWLSIPVDGINVDRLRKDLDRFDRFGITSLNWRGAVRLIELARQVLAAIDQEDSDDDACDDDPDGLHHIGCGCEDTDV